MNSMFTNTGPQLGQFEAGAVASVIGAIGATAMGGLLVTLIAAGLATVRSVRKFEVHETASVKTHEVPARA
ncbi:MAG TPA: hypothetical protein VGH22_14180 [Candidatus Binatia bacterium]